MKVLLVTGSFPPMACGVGDYTSRLFKALRKAGADVEVYHERDWSYGNLPGILGRIRERRPEIVHIQFPALDYGHSLAPQLLTLFHKPVVATLHEAKEVHPMRKASLAPIVLGAKHVIFTNESDRRYVMRYLPSVGSRSSVIPIGSNVGACRGREKKLTGEIVYFGLIRPKKGLEQVIELGRILPKGYRLRILGKPRPDSMVYYQRLRHHSESLPIIWSTGLSDGELGKELSRAAFAYMPFPDGASDRRGSLLALLANGVVTISTKGDCTPKGFDGVVMYADQPCQALAMVLKMSASGRWRQVSLASRCLANDYSWDKIARNHISIYNKALNASGRGNALHALPAAQQSFHVDIA